MKKLLFILFIMPVFLFSCKKEHSGSSTNPAGKKYKVTFNVANFLQNQTNFAVRHGAGNLASDTITNLSGYLDVLYYDVYGNNNALPVQAPMMQDSTMSNMGMITDSLPAGDYTITVAAGKKGLILTGYNDGAQEYYFSYGSPNFQDTFWGIAGFTVSNGPVSQSVTLHRTVGEIEVKILDNMPATADSLFMTVYPVPIGIALNGDESYTLGPLLQGTASLAVAIPASAKGKPNYTLDLLVGPTMPAILTVVCKDAANRVLGSAQLGGTPKDHAALIVQQNVKTVVSGDLFTGLAPSQSFQVQVDTAWSSTLNQQSFSLRRH